MARRRHVKVLAQIFAVLVPATFAAAQDVRIAAWNLEDDVTGSTGVNPNLNAGTDAVIEGIDSYTANGTLPAQTVDILGLEETSFNTTAKTDYSATNIVSDLNTFATSINSNAVYATAAIPAAAQQTGTGNGPNAIVYNTTTMTLLNSTAITGTGIDRPVMRYEFRPVGGASSQVFYVYVSHMKSSGSDTGSALAKDETMRNEEAQSIRTDMATLPSTYSIILMGDLNMSGSFEAAYQTLTQTTSASPYTINAMVDPANVADNYTQTWDSTAAFKNLFSETAKSLKYRDDIQLMSSNVYNDTGVLNYVANSQVPFGNNNSLGVGGNVSKSVGTGISSTVLTDLTTASDHLPIVSDFTFNALPLTLSWNNAGGTGDGTSWNTTSQNWNNGTGPALYADGALVTFNDANNGHYAVTISGTVAPGSLTVSNSGVNGNYTFSGSGSISGNTSLVKSGTGALTISTANSYIGGTVVNGGTLVVANPAALGVGGLTVHTGGIVQLQAGLATAVTLPSVTLDGATGNWTGALDITTSKLVVEDTSATHPSTVAILKDQAAFGATNHAAGIFDSATMAGGADSGKVVVVVDNGVAGLSTFGGVAVNAGSVLVLSTFAGDANLDGIVNIADLNVVASHWQQSVSDWTQGDFNGDGMVNIADLNILAADWQLGSGSGSGSADSFAALAGPIAAPEPASLGLLSMGAFLLLKRSRRFS